MVPVLLACSSTDSMSNHIMPALDVRAVSMVTVLPTLGRCVFFFCFFFPFPHILSCARSKLQPQMETGLRKRIFKKKKKESSVCNLYFCARYKNLFLFFQAALAPFLYFCRPLPPFKSQLCLMVIISSRLTPCPLLSLQNTFSYFHSRCAHSLRRSC